MKSGPDIALIASLVGDPARANMLTALIGGQALTATELAHEAGVTAQTASSHLGKLQGGGLVAPRQQGRHRYYSLTGADVAAVLEGLMGLAARVGRSRTRPGPKDPALRRARLCYDHLAGEMGVRVFDAMLARDLIRLDAQRIELTLAGDGFCAGLGIDLPAIRQGRRAFCRACLDWSARRSHLAGALGAALFDAFKRRDWLRPRRDGRAVTVTRQGEAQFDRLFPALGG